METPTPEEIEIFKKVLKFNGIKGVERLKKMTKEERALADKRRSEGQKIAWAKRKALRALTDSTQPTILGE